MYVQVFPESTNGTFLQNSMCELFDMLEQYIGNVGTHGLRAKLVWSLVTTKVPKCSYRVELLTVIWSNKYKKKWTWHQQPTGSHAHHPRCRCWSWVGVARDPSWGIGCYILEVPTPSLRWLKWISFKSCCCSCSLWRACLLHLGYYITMYVISECMHILWCVGQNNVLWSKGRPQCFILVLVLKKSRF